MGSEASELARSGSSSNNWHRAVQSMLFVTVCLVTLARPTMAFQELCGRGQGKALRVRPGEVAAQPLFFKYVAAIERFGSRGKKAIWCIVHDHRHNNIGHYKWGSKTNPAKYLFGMVDPGQAISRSLIDTSQIGTGKSKIWFRRKNRDNWRPVHTKVLSFQKFAHMQTGARIFNIQ